MFASFVTSERWSFISFTVSWHKPGIQSHYQFLRDKFLQLRKATEISIKITKIWFQFKTVKNLFCMYTTLENILNFFSSLTPRLNL